MASTRSTSSKIASVISESLYCYNKQKQDQLLNNLSKCYNLNIVDNNKLNLNLQYQINFINNYLNSICSTLKIQIESTLANLANYSPLEESTIILALVYLDRSIGNNYNIALNKYEDFYNLFIGSLLIAIKYNQDLYIIEALEYVSNIRRSDLNKLEYNILNTLNYNLYVNTKEFCLYEKNLKKIKTMF